MNRGLSLYLDLLRFGMAVIVWISHSTFHGYTGHPFILWRLTPYASTAVISFFVLSGFVIAHVTKGAEADPTTYAIARVSRLYSLVIPALVLTWIWDTLGSLADPSYVGRLLVPDNEPERYLLSLFMVQNWWIFGDLEPGTNNPFWSLSFEITYYICFGLFLTGRIRLFVGGSLLLFALAGPLIAALFPIWLLGVAVYRWQARRTLPMSLAIVLFPVSIGLLAYVGSFRMSDEIVSKYYYQLAYAEAALIAVNLLAASALSGWLTKVLGWCGTFVRWLGSVTFAIYLCHFPLLRFLTIFKINEPGTWQEHLWIFGGGFIIMALVARLGDYGRRHIRTVLTTTVMRYRSSPV
jgi:peptidoglycan/LPS O-acetylase OafA/YrhL